MKTVTIVDYGMGNLHSVKKATQYVCHRDTVVKISNRVADIRSADKIILPGQGAIAGCMRRIHDDGLYDAIVVAAKEKPFLAICIGPQLLMTRSEENGGTDGFGIFKGHCKRFSDDLTKRHPPLKIPHMGWNQITQTKSHALWKNIANGARFYFVHSYYLVPDDGDLVVGQCDYGHVFASALAKDNIFTLQCHPEKSADVGLQLFKNFIEWTI